MPNNNPILLWVRARHVRSSGKLHSHYVTRVTPTPSDAILNGNGLNLNYLDYVGNAHCVPAETVGGPDRDLSAKA